MKPARATTVAPRSALALACVAVACLVALVAAVLDAGSSPPPPDRYFVSVKRDAGFGSEMCADGWQARFPDLAGATFTFPSTLGYEHCMIFNREGPNKKAGEGFRVEILDASGAVRLSGQVPLFATKSVDVLGGFRDMKLCFPVWSERLAKDPDQWNILVIVQCQCLGWS